MKNKFLIFILFLIGISGRIFGEEVSIEEQFYETRGGDKEIVNELKLEQEMILPTLDPIKLTDSYSRRVIGMIYDSLFKIDNKGKISSELIEDYQWLDTNKLYIRLKPNIFFHNGKKLTAKDVEYSIQRLKRDGVVVDMYSSIVGFEIKDELSLIMSLKLKDSQILTALANPGASIIYEEDGKLYGTGPYMVKNLNSGVLKLKKFDNYHGDKGNLYDSIELRWESNSNQRLIKFVNGQEQIVFEIYKEDIERAKEMGLLGSDTVIKSGQIYDTIALMFGGKEYSLEQRKAINSAISDKAGTFFPKELLQAKLSINGGEYSTKEAKEQIKKSGLKGRELNIMLLNNEYNMRVAFEIKKDLEIAGMKVNIYPHNMVSFYQKLYARDYDVALYNINISGIYPMVSLGKIVVADIGNQDILGALIPFGEMIKSESDPQKINQIFDRILALLQKNVLYIPIEHRLNYYLGDKESIEGFEHIVGY